MAGNLGPSMLRSVVMAFSLLSASAPVAACTHKEMTLDCQVEGAKYLNGDLNDSQLCARFIDGMGKAGEGVKNMHITISQRGGISARWTTIDGEARDIGVDVMDRALRLSDFDQLATAASQLAQ